MCKLLFIILTLTYINYINVKYINASDIFHQGTKVTFHPDDILTSEYFGYAVVLSDSGLIVGAPKANNSASKTKITGSVFSCRLNKLDARDVICHPLGSENNGSAISFGRVSATKDFFKDDMWFGATISTVPTGKLLICAPRWATPYKDKHLLANGACYAQARTRGLPLVPLKEMNRQAFRTDGTRKEYGEYGTHLNFYAYGQAGMAVKVTENNSLIIGAPGLLQWTGGIIDYKYRPDPDIIFFSKQPTTNPYYTKDLGPDDYFGYSVESGIFQLNGKTLYVAGAPRSKSGFGQVLIFEPAFREMDPLNVRAKVQGPQLGSYFGASLCCVDLDADGRTDLLVGAPNFVKKDGGLPYDQGAVFVYLSREQESNFILEEAGFVSGSGESGARFGTSIASLGDIDGDGFNDIAIAAPWENNGIGSVYIYRGSDKGLNTQYVQRIVAEDARGFGISISKGFDVDNNNCNDLAVGAHKSASAYVYRCIPTMQVHTSIRVPDAMDLPQNATNFTAHFCISSPARKLWPHVKFGFKAMITIDPESNRAQISGNSDYNTVVSPGNIVCDEQTVEVEPTADLSRPISLYFSLLPMELMTENSTTFLSNAARLSEESTLHSKFDIQLTRDCGEDLICTPWLEMFLESLDNPYVPGLDNRLGAILTILNKEEPAYGAKVHITLPLQPKRVPSDCTLQGYNMSCDVPAPLHRMQSVVWEIELECTIKDTEETDLMIAAELEDDLYRRNISDGIVKELIITVVPEANFSVSGKALPNVTVPVTREKLKKGEIITFVHYFEVTNFGPSDWPNLSVDVIIPEKVTLSKAIHGCLAEDDRLECDWSVPAKVTMPIILQLRFNLSKHGEFLESPTVFNVTTTLRLWEQNKTASILTTLVLDPAPPIWPLIVGLVAGFLVLAVIVYGLYKYGFFLRKSHEELKRLQEQEQSSSSLDHEPSGSGIEAAPGDVDESTQELLSEDSL